MYNSSLFRGLASSLLLTIGVILFLGQPGNVHAATVSSWNPTLLVNTESFQTIDSGDGTTDIELRFGASTQTIKFLTTGKFQFSHPISVLGTISGSALNVDRNATVGGTLTVTGAVTGMSSITAKGNLSGATLTVSRSASISGTLLTKGNITGKANITALGILSGTTLRVSGPADIHGPLAVTGSIRTDGNLTLNDVAGAVDAVLTFGNASGNQTLKYLNASQEFQFSKPISVLGTISGSALNVDRNATVGGTLTVTGAVTGMSSITAKGNLSGATLTVSRSASISGALLTKGDITGKANITALGILSGANLTVSRSASISGTLLTKGNITGKGNITALGILSGTTLRVSGPADIHGPLAVTGSIRTDGNLTLNDIAAAVDAVLTFGNASGNQTLKYLNASQKFQFSKGISVLGTISGSALNVDRNATIGGSLTASGAIRTKSSISGATLTVDGNVTLHGQTYNFPTSQTSNGFLKTDGAGNLTWSATASIGNGSGEIISLHPEYPNAIYFSSGASFVGQLTASGGVAGLVQNFYRWTSSKAASQNYWIAVRVRLPDNFSSWDPVKPIELLYRTADGTAANNHVSVRMRDTAGALVALSNNVDLTNAGTFTTAKITGPEVGGPTWAPKGYITIYIKMAATTGKYADVGYLNLNFENTNP